MRRISTYTYAVSECEEVTIVCTPIGVTDDAVTVAMDGRILGRDPTSPPTYRFIVTKRPHANHIGRIECAFPKEGASTSRFEVTLRGSSGGDFNGPTVMKDDPISDPALTFEVLHEIWGGN